jgi:hypothetical protein
MAPDERDFKTAARPTPEAELPCTPSLILNGLDSEALLGRYEALEGLDRK